ncbi:MAG: transposase [Candidatus Omnitrophica bacterium]|nr:transposase [Candidatus Omnitrophota bacterium]
MPRIARAVAVGLPHHITQRGNFKQAIFGDDDDRRRYLYWVKKYSVEHDLEILAYCLMFNHVHFIVVPNRLDSLAEVFKTAHMRYSQYFNKKMNRSGHLWQGRFYSCILDEFHLIAAARYVELNPVRANIVEKPWEWGWSSARVHTNRGSSQILLNDLFKYMDMQPVAWRDYIGLKENEEEVERIRKHTRTGKPLLKM